MINFETSVMPRLYRGRYRTSPTHIEDPAPAVAQGMKPHLGCIKPGDRIGIAAGSRGIYHYAEIIKAVVQQVKGAGGLPHIIPAMGSHGGATAEGQAALLAGYGITEGSMEAPVLSCMDTAILGETSQGVPVHFDKNALGMDGIIMVNRVKPHTDFHSGIESGVVKQMVIGLGKHAGASAVHRRGVDGLTYAIPEAAALILEKANILMGVAILENEADRTEAIEVLPAESMLREEPALLEKARALMPALPVQKLDVLVLQQMGKNISGTGIDPNIVGRYLIRGVQDSGPDIYRIVCLSLTEQSHGNAIGVGMADIITRRMYEQIDLEPTYINTITSGFLERGFLPIIAANDSEGINMALNCCNRYITAQNARMLMVKNTLDLHEFIFSEALLSEIEQLDADILGEVQPAFNEEGYLAQPLFE